MKIRQQRVWLTALAVAGSVALYGCGGGSGGPDTTPYDQDYVDQKADEAKEAEEDRQAAIATATAAAARAAQAESDAAKAAADADAAAKAAAIAAKYETLDADDAESESTNAAMASGRAEAARMAADDALSDANSVVHPDPEVTAQKDAAQRSATAAAQSAQDAEKFADEALTSAQVARATQNGIEQANAAAEEQGRQRRIAANRALDADTAAEEAAAKVIEAKAARTAQNTASEAVKAANEAFETAETAAGKARDEFNTALKAAQDDPDDYTKASESLLKENALTDALAELAKARRARLEALSEQATASADAAAAAAASAASERSAAETAMTDAAAAAAAAGDTDPDSEGAKSAAAAAASYREARVSANRAQGWSDVLAIIGTLAETDSVENFLADILARIPWAEDQSRTEGDETELVGRADYAAERLEEQTDPDSGQTAAYQDDISGVLQAVTNDKNNIDSALASARAAHDAARPWSENGRAVDNATGAEGENLATGAILINQDGRINLGGHAEDDPATPANERINVLADATSPLSEYGTNDYKMDLGLISFGGNYHLTHYNRWGAGIDQVYEYVAFGIWSSADRTFTSHPHGTIYTDRFTSPTERGAGNLDGGAFALVRDGAPATVLDAIGTARFTGHHLTYRRYGANDEGNHLLQGNLTGWIDFAKSTAGMDFGHPSFNGAWFSVRDIKLDGNVLSGGNFSADTSRFGNIILTRDDAKTTLHAGIFGENAEEIAGTLRMSGTNSDDEEHVLSAAFALRNNEYR